ncbi:hypothetical protein N9Y55_02760, partial [bacterium]|nr:hypothetical protein [bacterium]
MITPTRLFYTAAPRTPRRVAKGIDRTADWISGAIKRRKQLRRRLKREAAAALKLHDSEIAPLSSDGFQDLLAD